MRPPTADLATLFDAATLTPATTTDRAVVLDEGLPKVTGDLDVVSTPVALLGLGDQNGGLTLVSAAMVVDAKGQTAVKGDPLHIVRNAEFVVQPDRLRRLEDHRLPHGRHARRRRPLADDHDDGHARDDGGPEVRRRALTLLLVAPVLCGLLLAGGISAAWMLLGEPVPAGGCGVVPGDEARCGTGDAAGRNSRSSRSVLGTGARSDDPAQSPDDPGLADAIHVIGVNPALTVGDRAQHPRATPRGRAGPSSTRTSSTTGAATTCAPRPTRCRRSSACRSAG